MPATEGINGDSNLNFSANGARQSIANPTPSANGEPRDDDPLGAPGQAEDLGAFNNSLADIRDGELSIDLRGEAAALVKRFNAQAATEPKPLPIVRLPGGDQRISDTAAELGKQLAGAQTHFNKGGAVVRVVPDEAGRLALSEVNPAALTSDLEAVARLMEKDRKGDIKRATCSEGKAKLILASRNFVVELPPLRVFSSCPLLVEQNDELRIVAGYDRASGILAQGEIPEEVELAEAVARLDEMLADFQFATPADRSRALAATITPAMNMGGLLPGRAALDLGEADDSQAGKGYRQRLTAAVYGQSLAVVTVQKAGVGSLEEAFDRQLIAGKNFILLDNVRGKIDSPKIESFLTEDSYNARCSFSRNMEIDPRRTCVMFTSNKADITKDLANRSSCVRIQKQPDGYQYRRYPEGDILDRVRAQQRQYLGAVFAVVRAWYAAGKPRTDDTRHDFRGWGQTLDWIVQNLLEAAPLLDGHRETQERMTNPALNWLRDLALAVVRQGKASEWLTATGILECIDEQGDIEIPGARAGVDYDENSDMRKQVLSQIGKRMRRCFRDSDELALDGLTVVRESYTDELFRDRWRYMVYRQGEAPVEVPF